MEHSTAFRNPNYTRERKRSQGQGKDRRADDILALSYNAVIKFSHLAFVNGWSFCRRNKISIDFHALLTAGDHGKIIRLEMS